MREYVVIKIECPKGRKITEIYKKINETLKFNRTFFEFFNLFNYRGYVSKKKQEFFESLGLQRYFHVKVLEHLARSPHYDPDRDDVKLISNLDDSWEWNNKRTTESLDNSVFQDMLTFSDGLKMTDVVSMLIGIDEIEWNGQKVNHGTYGYEKAKSGSHGGENYLSNSIIISRIPYEHKPYTVYLSCEKRFRELDNLNNIIEFLGKIKSEKIYFAPENEEERAEWKHAYKNAEIKFQKMQSEFYGFIETLPNHLEEYKGFGEFDEKINVRKLIKKYLCTDGWEKIKSEDNRVGITVCKRKGNDLISVTVVSQHGGHYLQMLIYNENIKYNLGWNPCYSFTFLHENDVCSYMENIKCIMEYVYDSL